MEAGSICKGDSYLITGPTTGVVEGKVEKLIVNEKENDTAVKGDSITFPVHSKIRENDTLFVVKEVVRS